LPLAKEAAVTLFEKKAWLELALFLMASVALMIALIISGLAGLDSNEAMRILVEAVVVAMAVSYAVGMWLFRRQLDRKGVAADERDRGIVIRARASQLGAVIVGLVAWTIALTEYYWDAGSLPVGVLYPVFLSLILAMGLTGAVAVLVGYHRTTPDG
jgi:Na+/H+ antiporter NhaD/arsenite permease-like protein